MGHLAATFYLLSSLKVDLAFDICLVELASPLVESEVVGFAELPAIAEVVFVYCLTIIKLRTGG